MLRVISLIVFAIAGLLPCAPGAAGESALAQVARERSEWAARVAPAVVAIEARAANGERYYGAGTVVSADGLVLTSITAAPPQAREVRVIRADGSWAPVAIVCSAPETETVLLQMGRADGDVRSTFLAIGRSDEVCIGDPVLAAGNPHETLRRDGQTFASFGTLTGRYTLDSDDRASRYRGTVLETDASINPGSDGGPLIDARGRLIGLLSLAYTRTRWQGTAVPMERVLDRLPNEWKKRLCPEGKAPSVLETRGPWSAALRQAARPLADAIVRLEFHRTPETNLVAASAGTPHAAPVTQQETGISPMATRPEMAVTGMLIEPRGTVLTSALNLEGVDGPITVVTADGRRYRAKPRGRHLDLDIAVLKLEGVKGHDELPSVPLSPTQGLRPGSFIGVLGIAPQPDGEPTFATGIVSATHRFDGLAVQIDARTNYGNAGGPVTDLQGRFLGIVTQVGTRKCWGQSSGVGFFAPAEQILQALDALRDGKTLRRAPQPFLGVTPAIGESEREGVKLGAIVKNSPAWRAGLREDDLITAADGQVTRSWSGLVRTLKTHQPGEELRLQVLRGQKVVLVPVTLSAKE